MRVELIPSSEKVPLLPLPVRISGRAAQGPGPYRFIHHWPGFHTEARFRGRSVIVRLADDVNRLRIVLDEGGTGVVEVSRPGSVDLRISGLSDGAHTIRLQKFSESSAPAQFGGFFVDSEGEAMPAPQSVPRLIEFIGDSDTVGFGSTSERRDCNDAQIFAATDSTKAFGPRVAAGLNADYRVIARSGIGLVRNYEGADRGDTMPRQYGRGLPDDAESVPIPETAPDVIVVGLGSNDFGSALQANERWKDYRALREDFAPALTAFLQARARECPQAIFILLAFGEYGEELIGAYHEADSALRRGGTKSSLVILPKLDRRGCQWHPSPRDHAMIADRLIAAIAAKEPSWSTTPQPIVHQ